MDLYIRTPLLSLGFTLHGRFSSTFFVFFFGVLILLGACVGRHDKLVLLYFFLTLGLDVDELLRSLIC